ncbi:hypothetical protein ABT56_01315 [Photobacterium aquae]|uniref:Transmembrane protein n=1 Tax=Photobacterium aquae TaxID=1195763 RepID=A0A0J1HB50_9GAMM|nr:YfiR family protein [Photobacterium aquae]KLV08883.1 hypothetical protein ABT56_01315 [Photobacterium aquae]
MNKPLLPTFLIVPLTGLILMLISAWAKAGSEPAAGFAAHQIKAVYIYRLASFIRWPGDTVLPKRFCVIGRNSITLTLGTLLDKNKLQLLSPTSMTEASKKCDLLYITEQKLSAFQSLPQYPGLLTISDNPNTLAIGGMIELRTINNQVKPAISSQHIHNANLSVSSMLMRIAITDDEQTALQQEDANE